LEGNLNFILFYSNKEIISK